MLNALSHELVASGLSEKQAVIYGALIQLGGTASPTQIASITKVKRPTVYAILDEFDLMNVVKKLEQNKKIVYQLQPVEQLHRYIRDRARFHQHQFEKFQDLFPELKNITQNLSPNSPIRYFEGPKIKDIYEHHVTFSGYIQYGFSSAELAFEMFDKRYLISYAQRKEKNNIRGQAIMAKTSFNQKYPKHMYQRNTKKFLPKLAFVPEHLWPIKSEIVLYANEYISLVTKVNNTWQGIIIHDKQLYQTFLAIFHIAWIGAQTFRE